MEAIILYDHFYGRFVIDQPVLIELLQCKTLTRLKGISQGGYYPGCAIQKVNFTRYDHSIGVFLLLRKFNASLAQQIAGLIHDVSHCPFSHTIDYVYKDVEREKAQDGQDRKHESFVKASEIAEILARHKFDIDFILDDKNFPLKENQVPQICADRIDYCLRDCYYSLGISIEQIKSIVNSLVVVNSEFMFDNYQSALAFAEGFRWCNQHIWCDFSTAIAFSTMGKILKIALDNRILTIDQVYQSDNNQVIEILKRCKNNQIISYLQMLNNDVQFFVAGEQDRKQQVFCKTRKVNPKFLDNGNILTVTDRNPLYKRFFDSAERFVLYEIKDV